MGLRMVLERYDVGLVREHVMKTRFLLHGNAPCVLRVVGAEEEGVEEQVAEPQKTAEKINGTHEANKEEENGPSVSVLLNVL